MDLVRQTQLLQHDVNFMAVRRGGGIDVDHFFSMGCAPIMKKNEIVCSPLKSTVDHPRRAGMIYA
jgi:hypothetical protein